MKNVRHISPDRAFAWASRIDNATDTVRHVADAERETMQSEWLGGSAEDDNWAGPCDQLIIVKGKLSQAIALLVEASHLLAMYAVSDADNAGETR
jgi:hypothetical protein